MIVYKNIPDHFITMSSKVSNIKKNILNKKDFNQKSLNKRKLNKVGVQKYNNQNISLYEIPIFYGTVDENTIYWILSFEINDIVRIFISNNIDIDEDYKIIHSKS